MEFKNLKRAMFGYSKSSVIEYAAALSEEFNTKLVEKAEENEKCRKELSDLKDEKNELLKKIEELEKEMEEKEKASASREALVAEKLKIGELMMNSKKYAGLLRDSAATDFKRATQKNKELLDQQKKELNEFMEKIEEFKTDIFCFLIGINEDLNKKQFEIDQIADSTVIE